MTVLPWDVLWLAASPNQGVRAAMAALSIEVVLVTLALVAGAYAVTRLIRWQFEQRDLQHVAPNWLLVLMRMVLPVLLWCGAYALLQWYVPQRGGAVWFEFLSRLFFAWFWVRLFLFVVRRALPEGAHRATMERLIMVLVWGLMWVDYLGHLDDVVSVMEGWKLKFGVVNVSALDVAMLLASLLILWLVVKWLAHELDEALILNPHVRLSRFDLSARMVLVRLLKGGLIAVAVLLSLSAAGIDLTVLSVFGGALGVGIGLGLQKIASNYVSGFVMLFERSVRVGDLISTSDGTRGFVRTINARYTLIEGTSGDEVLVPNELLIVNPVVNWTLHDTKNWMSTKIPIAYEIDLDFIMPKIVEAVQALARVAQSPKPNVFLSSISDKGYILEITWWLLDPENGRLNVISEVNLAAWRVLRAHNVDVFTLKPGNGLVGGEGVAQEAGVR